VKYTQLFFRSTTKLRTNDAMGAQLHEFLTSIVGEERSVSRLGHFIPWGKIPPVSFEYEAVVDLRA
jgi:hypothetical protein